MLASSNPGKLREFEALLAPLGTEIVSQSSLGIADAEEPHGTFVENALAKARHASRRTKLPALADDSGICVAVLGGEPGVHSARFAGEPRSDARNNEKLIETLADKDNRRAHYCCVIVLMRHPDDPEPVIAEGSWAGEIIAEPRGANGFGYDPVFVPDEGDGRTFAEMTLSEKQAVSHRGRAFRALAEALWTFTRA